MKKLRAEDHPLGGTFTFFDLGNGQHASILDDKYPHHEDFEIHLRDVDDQVILGTERHEPTMKDAIGWLELVAEGRTA